jgi:hypothetical protein
MQKSNTDIFEAMLPAFSGVKYEASHFNPKGRGSMFQDTDSAYKNAWCHNPKDHTLNSPHCENLTSLMKFKEVGLKL